MSVNASHTDVPESILEPDARKGIIKKPDCPNCGHHFEGADNWCPKCGQANRTHKRPVQYFIREFFEELISLDLRFFGTFRDLIIKPGLLTKNYNADLRVRYTSPLRFYVIASVLFFLTVSWMTRTSIQSADSQLQNMYEENDSLYSTMDITIIGNQKLEPEDWEALIELDPLTVDGVDSVLTARGKETNWFTNRIVIGVMPLLTGGFSVEQYFQRLMRNFSYSFFFFMPLFALILKILYIRRHQFYTEHLIFSIHLHTFAFLNIFFFLWVDYFQDYFMVTPFIVLTIPIYMLFAIKVVYEQGWGRTFIKSILSFWMYMAVAGIGFTFLTIFSIFS